jgi:glycosyltransferase involved in cell wall biosynthesis
MKRILLVTYSLDLGGLERMVVSLANGLDPREFEARVCCIAHAGPLARSLRSPDMLHVIGHEGRINYRACAELHRLVRRLSIDVVHTHNTPGLLYAYCPAALARAPIVHTNHGVVFTEKEHGAVGFTERLISRRVARYVCVSEHLKGHVAREWRMPESSIEVVYNGVDLPDLSDEPRLREGREILIGSVGNLRAIKNYALLVSAFASLVRRHPRCRLELVGDGPDRESLESLSRELGVADTSHFVGHAPEPSVYLKKFDVFVLPSLSEGISLSILEAMAAKKICLVSNVGGTPEIVEDAVNGFLFTSNDSGELAEKLISLVDRIDSAELDRVRERARTTVERKFSLAAMVRRYGDLYDAAGRR